MTENVPTKASLDAIFMDAVSGNGVPATAEELPGLAENLRQRVLNRILESFAENLAGNMEELLEQTPDVPEAAAEPDAPDPEPVTEGEAPTAALP